MQTLTHSLIAFFACAILTLTSFAGPEPIRDYKDSKDKVIAPVPPPMTWTGFYLGANAGYSFSRSNRVDTTSTNTFAFPGAGGPNLAATITDLSNFNESADTDGFIGGGQMGYNRQFANCWVAGVETDIQAMDSQGSSSVASSEAVSGFANTVFQTGTVSRSIDYLGTFRGRFGFLARPSLLLYGTGGLAYGNVTASTNIAQNLVPPNSIVPEPWLGTGATSDMRLGWTAGAGVEWMFCRHWSVKAEYLHFDLGTVGYGLSPLVTNAAAASPFTTHAEQSKTSFEGEIVRAGLNFHF